MQLYQVIVWCESHWEEYKGMFYFKYSVYENLLVKFKNGYSFYEVFLMVLYKSSDKLNIKHNRKAYDLPNFSLGFLGRL